MRSVTTMERNRETSIDERVETFDWADVATHLDSQGWAMIEKILTAEECQAFAALYGGDSRFRSHIIMARHGFGRGEYKYFSYPLPDIIKDLRAALYTRLVPIANRWNELMGIDVRYPDAHADFIKRCHEAGDTGDTAWLAAWTSRMI